ncbi:MAG: hypothetical protein WCV99_15295 [Sterolibacterium sp.]|jgi:hypothetical protein
MKRHVFFVVAVVAVFLGLIVAYSMTPPDASSSGGSATPAAKH